MAWASAGREKGGCPYQKTVVSSRNKSLRRQQWHRRKRFYLEQLMKQLPPAAASMARDVHPSRLISLTPRSAQMK